MTLINLEADQVWSYALTYLDELQSCPYTIATDSHACCEIKLKVVDDQPMIIVLICGEIEEEYYPVDEDECIEILQDVFWEYLDEYSISFGKATTSVSNASSILDENEDELDEIDERESELIEAIDEFIGVAVPNMFDFDEPVDEIYNDLIDIICEYLYRERNISVYRPMYLESDDGNKEFHEYPYANMEFVE